LGKERTVGPTVLTFCVLLDLDQTLVDTAKLKPLRDRRQWSLIGRSLHLSSIISGAQDLIEALKNETIPHGIVTSAPRMYAEQVVDHHRLSIRVVTAYHDTRAHKPAAAPVLHGMKALNASAGVYIGDAEIDRAAAIAAGVHFLGVPPISPETLPQMISHIRALMAGEKP
jgi:phosphoglycolate phosphatase-like HAD superfamily hydrolase